MAKLETEQGLLEHKVVEQLRFRWKNPLAHGSSSSSIISAVDQLVSAGAFQGTSRTFICKLQTPDQPMQPWRRIRCKSPDLYLDHRRHRHDSEAEQLQLSKQQQLLEELKELEVAGLALQRGTGPSWTEWQLHTDICTQLAPAVALDAPVHVLMQPQDAEDLQNYTTWQLLKKLEDGGWTWSLAPKHSSGRKALPPMFLLISSMGKGDGCGTLHAFH